MRIPLFRIWYSTTYTILLIILILLLAITPADTIYQSIKSHEIQKLFVVGGVYLLACLIVLLIYSTRIYTNRTVLAAIPKGYVPVEEGEVGKGVRRMVVKHLKRSAVLAWDSKPRDVRREGVDLEEGGEDQTRPNTAESKREKDKDKAHKKKGTHHAPDATIILVDPQAPPWGHVSHPGWTSPSSDLPNLHYWSVICELPNLIEAKAVSLAPPDLAIEDRALQDPDNAPPLPDAQIVTLIQRPRAMGLRDYLARLARFGLLNPPSLAATFLAQYERARFSTDSLTETEFKDIMAVFADILNGMIEIDFAIIEEARALNIGFDTRSLAPTESSSTSTASRSDSSISDIPYRTPQLDRQRSRLSLNDALSGDRTHSPNTLHTASSRHQQRSPMFTTPHAPSEHSLRSERESETGSVMRHEVQRSPSTVLSDSSSESMGDGRSVIRLQLNPSGGELPYRFERDGG